MPAVTLGFAEIEDRLNRLRRRLNLFALENTGCVVLSAVALAATAVLVAALRVPPSAFPLILWISAGLVLAIIGGLLWRLWRGWRDLPTVATLVDQRARLQNRMATLLAHRGRQPPPRLLGLLLAEVLALGPRWDLHVVAPRRVPHSAYLLVAAVATFVLAVLVAGNSWAPESTDPSTVASGRRVTAEAASLPFAAANVVFHPAPRSAAEHQKVGQGDLKPGRPDANAEMMTSSAAQESVAGEAALGDEEYWSSGEGQHHPGASGNAFAQQIQQIVREAFDAEALGRPRQLARRPQDADWSDEDPTGKGDGGSVRQDHPATGSGSSVEGRRKNHPGRKAGETAKPGQKAGQGEAGSERQDDQRSGEGTSPQGPQPPGGTGSNASSLLARGGGHGALAAAQQKTFKVTLTSFLQGALPKPAPHSRSRRGGVAGDGYGPGAREEVSLSEHQLGDDLLRKAEIPPEFEDIVRHVFSQQASD